jgi:hypothetical protein
VFTDWTAGSLPVVWAQTTSASATATTGTTVSNQTALAFLALRRWFASFTLSSPESVPSLFGLWAWLLGLLGLLVVAMFFQGVGPALRQVLDIPAHVRLIAAANRRLRRSGRMLAAVVGMTVLSWTGSQSFAYNRPEGRDDVVLLTKARGLGELAVEQGVLAGLTPLRDVVTLGANLPLLLAATLLLFRASTDAWSGSLPPPGMPRRKRISGWGNIAWCCGALFILYRMVAIGSGMSDLPLGGCLMVEAVVIPALMAVSDGLLLGWVLVELRDAGYADSGDNVLDVHAATRLLPGTILACLAALPARYLATAVFLGSWYLPSSASTTALGAWVRWQLGWGLVDVQGAALLVAGLAGAVAWSGGRPLGALRGYARMLSTHGGQLTVLFGLAGLAAGTLAASAYLAVLSLPAASWVLNAADSYAHYATMPVGLWTLSVLVELGERSLPEATLVPIDNGQAHA